MIPIQFNLLKDLFALNTIVFVWRASPGFEERAVVNLSPDIALEPYSMLIGTDHLWSMGAFSYSQSSLPAQAVVGRYCSVSNAVRVFEAEHPTHWISTSPFSYDPASAPIFELALATVPQAGRPVTLPFDDKRHAPVFIGNDVWIGQNVQLKRGITIGDGAVIAAGAVVTGDVEEFSVVGGVPAKIIRQRFPDDLIVRIKQLPWWEYNFTEFKGLDVSRPDVFMDGLADRVALGRIQKYAPDPVTIHTIKRHLETLSTG